MRNVDTQKYVTFVSADVVLRYERDGNYVDITSGYALVACFSLSTSRTLCLRTSPHIVPNSGLVLINHVRGLWDHPIGDSVLFGKVLMYPSINLNRKNRTKLH